MEIKDRKNILLKDERKKLISNCGNLKEKMVITTLLYTGMRSSELSNLKNNWIKWNKNIIRIPYNDGNWKAKNKSSERDIPLIKKVKNVLEKWFENKNNVDMNRCTIFRVVKRVAQRTDIKKEVYPRSLRITFPSILNENNINLFNIKSIMGWMNVSTVNNYVISKRNKNNFRNNIEGIE